jgi:acetylornithine deacetylase
VGPGWTRDPWDGAIENGRLHGRGSNDAKSSVAAMAVAAAQLDPSSFSGRLVLAFVCDEETGGEGIEACADDLPPCDAALVGEPTELDVCPGQRGLLRARLVAHGRSCHASRPHEGLNALEIAARDITALAGLDLGTENPLLGRATLQATVCHAGTRSNVIPGEATVELDGRPTPECDNQRMLELIASVTQSELVVHSQRLVPAFTRPDAEIVRLAAAASPTGRVRGFGGMSDYVHLAHLPGAVMGPGTSDQSHSPDESVAVEQVALAVEAYGRIAGSFLTAHAPAQQAAAQGETP